eukprot:gene4066-5091_t
MGGIKRKNSGGSGKSNNNNGGSSFAEQQIKKLEKEIEEKEIDYKLLERELKQKKKELKDEQTKNKSRDSLIEKLRELNQKSTKSIAIGSDILDDINSEEMKVYLIEMISRVLLTFQIDEIIIYKNNKDNNNNSVQQDNNTTLLLKILEFIETPSYLREFLFNVSDTDYKYVDKLIKINSVQSQSKKASMKYRDGIVSEEYYQGKSLVNVGLDKMVLIDRKLRGGIRVTVEFLNKENEQNSKYYSATVISPQNIKSRGDYWGYQLRFVDSVNSISDSCPFERGDYDFKVLLENNFDDIQDDEYDEDEKQTRVGKTMEDLLDRPLKKYHHLLFIFSPSTSTGRVSSTSFKDNFDLHLNLLSNLNNQSTSPTRPEENLLICLSQLKGKLF